MLANIGPIGFVVILIVALLLFGPKKLPELGRATGQTLKNFREAVSGKAREDQEKKED